ncbi:MAG: hypothetical protein IPF54_25685 [Draconibacterium sp.]|nr:hypothetical protein [Draconibacterium sp.]
MKNQITKLLLLAVFVFSVNALSAQLLNKKSLVADLNNTEGVALTPQQQKDYESINNKLADDLVKASTNSKSKEELDKETDRLFDKRDKDVDGIFGVDDKYQDTKKSLKKSSRKMRMKVKMAKLVL